MRKILRSAGDGMKAYLTFNYAERRGIIVLVMLILIIESVNALLPAMATRETHDFSEFEQELKQFEAQMICQDTSDKPKKNTKTQSNYRKPSQYKEQEREERKPIKVELNSADSVNLLNLYGIGPSFAHRIIIYRGMLGGFYEEKQLLEVYGMDSSRLEMFREQLIINTDSIRKIAINKATFKELLKHPYLDYETVRDIVNYRERVASITHPDTLRSIIGYEPMFEKVKHYVEYGTMNME